MTQTMIRPANEAYGEIQRREDGTVYAPIQRTPEEERRWLVAEIARTSVFPGLAPPQVEYAALVCQRTGLDPWKKQIYFWVDKGKVVAQTGVDGFIAIAESTGLYEGMIGPLFCGKDGQYTDTWLDDAPPVACKVGILRRDYREPQWTVCRYVEFVRKSNSNWLTAPVHMLGVRTICHAIRKTFQKKTEGLEIPDDPTTPPTMPAAQVREEPAPRHVQALRSGEQHATYSGAAGVTVGPCAECRAPEGKPHGSSCSRRSTTAPAGGEDLELRPTPAGLTPKQKVFEANKRLHQLYEEAGGDIRDREAMREHCSYILAQREGAVVEVNSISHLTAEDRDVCADWLLEHRALPERPDWFPSADGDADGQGDLYDRGSPFEDEE